MKATGIIRRIDDLGRIVIPKEIRKNLRIQKGENLELYTDNDNNIILKKYSQINKIEEVINIIVDVLSQTIKKDILITSTDKIIITSKAKKKYYNKELSMEIIKQIKHRKEIIIENQSIEIIEGHKEKGYYIISPIITNGDIIGSIIIESKEEIKPQDKFIVKIISDFLKKYIEE